MSDRSEVSRPRGQSGDCLLTPCPAWALARQWDGLPFYVMRRYFTGVPDRLFEDLRSEATIALYEAARRFDLTVGVKFQTYATRWIWGRLMTFCKVHEYEILCDRGLIHSRQVERFDSAGDETSTFEPTGREPDPAETIAESESDEMRAVRIASDQLLSERERLIITLRFGLDGRGPRTLSQIGKRFGVSKERIRQIITRTLGQVRSAVGVPPPPPPARAKPQPKRKPGRPLGSKDLKARRQPART